MIVTPSRVGMAKLGGSPWIASVSKPTRSRQNSTEATMSLTSSTGATRNTRMARTIAPGERRAFGPADRAANALRCTRP